MTVVGLVFELLTNVLIVFLCSIIIFCFIVLVINVYDDYRTLLKEKKK
jgi:hypothetical protein